MKIQILKEKNSNKVRGWGDGQAYHSAEDCDTMFREITDDEHTMLSNGDYMISEIKENGDLVIEPVSRIYPVNSIKKKIEEGTATIEDLKEAIKNLL